MGIAVGRLREQRPCGLCQHRSSLMTTMWLFRNDGDGIFDDVSYRVGHGAPTIPFVGLGDGFLDYDNDGWKDLLIVNGHVYPEVDEHPDWGMSYAQRPLLFQTCGTGHFEVVPAVEGTGPGEACVRARRGIWRPVQRRQDRCRDQQSRWRSTAAAQRESGSSPLGRADSSLADRRVRAMPWVRRSISQPGGIRQRGDVLSGGSYLSSNDMRVHFGLGDAAKMDAMEIHWPSGAVEKVKLPAVDRIYTIDRRQGRYWGVVRRQGVRGWCGRGCTRIEEGVVCPFEPSELPCDRLTVGLPAGGVLLSRFPRLVRYESFPGLLSLAAMLVFHLTTQSAQAQGMGSNPRRFQACLRCDEAAHHRGRLCGYRAGRLSRMSPRPPGSPAGTT